MTKYTIYTHVSAQTLGTIPGNLFDWLLLVRIIIRRTWGHGQKEVKEEGGMNAPLIRDDIIIGPLLFLPNCLLQEITHFICRWRDLLRMRTSWLARTDSTAAHIQSPPFLPPHLILPDIYSACWVPSLSAREHLLLQVACSIPPDLCLYLLSPPVCPMDGFQPAKPGCMLGGSMSLGLFCGINPTFTRHLMETTTAQHLSTPSNTAWHCLVPTIPYFPKTTGDCEGAVGGGGKHFITRLNSIYRMEILYYERGVCKYMYSGWGAWST